MFGTTFLGHQGWLFQTDASRVLVDPLLCEDFGHTHALEYRVFPPRAWQLDKLGPVDAVVLTHEHDDHFDIPSLAKLSRKIPIYLSSRSSIAGSTILREMGFDVRPLTPGIATKLGDMELVPFAGDHITTNCGDEWDTLPFLVKHGDGSMFSMVDITLTQGHVEWAKSRGFNKPGIVSWTNNALDWSHMAPYMSERVEVTQQTFMRMGTGRKLFETVWGVPQAMVICAGGFAFTGDRAALNQRVFCVDTDGVCAAMKQLYPKERFVSGIPGQTLWMERGKLGKIENSQPFLGTQPPESWPSRAKAQIDLGDYAPATGRRALRPGELDTLAQRLDELAGILLGGMTFRSLCSLLASESDKRIGFSFALRDGDARYAFAYEPSACRFVRIDDAHAYLAGLECWASDMNAVLAGEMGPIALTYGRATLWNALPKRFRFDIFADLNLASHPLRRPDAYLATYRTQYAAAETTKPVIESR